MNNNENLKAENSEIQNTNISNNVPLEQNQLSQSENVSNATSTNFQQTDSLTSIQNDLQSIATVEQSNENFINNSQSESSEKVESSEGKMNYAFIIILFIVIFAVVYFLFPLISKYI